MVSQIITTIRTDECVCACDLTLNFRATTGNKLQQDIGKFYKNNVTLNP